MGYVPAKFRDSTLLKMDLLGSLFYLCKTDIVIISKGVCVVHRFLFNFYKARIVSVTISFGLDLQQLQAAAAGSSQQRWARRHLHDEFNCNQTAHAHIALDCHYSRNV